MGLQEEVKVWERSKGFARCYAPEHVLWCIQAGGTLANQSQPGRTVAYIMNFLFPHTRRDIVAEAPAQPADLFSRHTVVRSIVVLDQASMLWNRAGGKKAEDGATSVA